MKAERHAALRRQSWWGLKASVKKAVSWPGINGLAHHMVRATKGASSATRLPAPRSVRKVTARMCGTEFSMYGPDRCILAKEIYWGQGKRPAQRDQTALDVFGALARGSDRVIDIGSYTGIFSLLAASVNPKASIDAFEIVPDNYLACLRNVVGNNLASAVNVHLVGVGHRSDIVMPFDVGTSALPDYLSIDDQQSEGVTVPIIPLSDVLGQSGDAEHTRVLVKIDVEGSENDVIMSGELDIRRLRPTFLVELLPGAEAGTLCDLFDALDYAYYLVVDGELRRCTRPQGVPDYRDWLITPLLPEDLSALGVRVDPQSNP